MKKCHCESCSPEPRYTYTVEFMRLCEARYVAGLPTLERRRAYITGVQQKRGEQSATELKQLVESITEAWMVRDMPTLRARQNYIEQVRAEQGVRAAEKLGELVKQEWSNRSKRI